MKLGIIGTGMIVREFLSVLDQMPVERVYLWGRNREAVDELADRYGLGRFYDYGDLLRCDDIDAVYVALPNVLHAAFGRQALEAGKHVIMEKPITASYAEFQDLSDLAREKDLLLMEAVTVHYLPAYQDLKKNLSQLGRIRMVIVNYSQYSSRYDKFREGEVLPAFDPAQAGGALMDLNVYNLHFAVGLFGPPLSASYHATIERGIDTSGVMVLDYPGFQAVCVGAKNCAAPIQSTIQGETGSLVIQEPCNSMTSYERYDRLERSARVLYSENPENTIPHRMAGEFRAFDWIIRNHDRETCREMLDISGTVVRIMEEGRRQEGIVFPGDR